MKVLLALVVAALGIGAWFRSRGEQHDPWHEATAPGPSRGTVTGT